MIHSSLEEAAREVDIAVEWRAFELRPEEARSEMDDDWLTEKKKQIEAGWPHVQQVAKDTYGLTLKRGPWGIDSRAAHIGAKAARASGLEDHYHKRIFEAYWNDQTDISDVAALAELAVSLGLDREAFLANLEDETLKAEVMGEEMGAHQIGVRGVPAIIIANRYLISGAQPKETLVPIFQEYAQKGTINRQ